TSDPDALIAVGRFEEVVAKWPTSVQALSARVFLGRFDDLSATDRDSVIALMAEGRYDRALERWGKSHDYAMWPRHMLGLEAFIRGDTAEARRLFAVPPRSEFHQVNFHLVHYAIVPFLAGLDGDVAALDRTSALFESSRRYVYEQKPWYNAGYLSGKIDESGYLAQKHDRFAPADLLLLRGIRAERETRTDDALRDYRAYLALERWQRSAVVDPVLERFVSWRIDRLARGD
ncbi:MAG: hypothetical protein H0V44_11085, partial [Planctomycetes bacterium]|nr:hypothetical protein [Planctomycetota bacterium]